MAVRTLSTIKLFNEKYPAFPIGGIQHKKFNQETNGAKILGVFVTAEGRVYIDDDRWFLWIEVISTGELKSVVELILEAERKGKYLLPEDAVAQVRGVAA